MRQKSLVDPSCTELVSFFCRTIFCQLLINYFESQQFRAVASHPEQKADPRAYFSSPTESAGRAGRKEGGLGPQPGPAGSVHRLVGERADQDGQ